MPIDDKLISTIAQQYIKAERDRSPIDPISSTYPDLTIDDAYRINQAIIDTKIQQGGTIVGMKLGATSTTIQQHFSINQPLIGYLLEQHAVADGGSMSMAQMIHPRVECEVAFILGADLAGPHCTIEDVMAATDSLQWAIEIVDPRTRDWQVTALDIIADSLIIAGFVVGGSFQSTASDLPTLTANLLKNGEVVSSGSGADVLGNPAQAVVQLVNHLAEENKKLTAGQIVMSGSLTALIPVTAGDTIEVESGGQIRATVKFH